MFDTFNFNGMVIHVQLKTYKSGASLKMNIKSTKIK